MEEKMISLEPKGIRIVNLDKDTTSQTLKIFLKDHLHLHGKIENIYVRNNRELCLVFAYVIFEFSSDARRAVVTLDGFDYKSMKLDVAIIAPDSSYKKYTSLRQNKVLPKCKDAQTEEEKKTDELYSKARDIDTCEHLQGFIDLCFNKAVDEPNYTAAVARVCSRLSLLQVPTANSTPEKPEFVKFRQMIINRCQMEFEKQFVDESVRNGMLQAINECEDPEKLIDLQFELKDYDKKLRMKSVGNIRFIGELFKQKILTVSIMMRCLTILLENRDEESYECLCKLLTTAGKELESSNVSLNPIFASMKLIAENKHGGPKVSSRIRFMIQDVIDLRLSKWVPSSRKDDRSQQGPRGNDRRGGGGGGRNNVAEDGGCTTMNTSRNRTPFTVQSDKLKSRTQLEFLTGGKKNMSFVELQDALTNVLASNSNIDSINQWISANVGDAVTENVFLRALATAIFTVSIDNKAKLSLNTLKEYLKLFSVYVDNDNNREMQCLYALQTLINKMEHPQGLLLQICNNLYELGAISEESFVAWEKDDDPAEQAGKGVTLKQLTSFFTQLKESDDDFSSSGSED